MFIKNGNQYLDIGSTATAEFLAGARGAVGLKFRGSAGREIGTVGGVDFDIERLTAPLVASSGPPSLAIFVCVEQTDHRPTADDIRVECAAVVAYRICRGGVEPVYLGTVPSGELFLGLAGGKLLEAATGRLHDGVEGAKQAAPRTAQQRYDGEHGAPEPTEPEIETVEQKVELVKLVGGRRAR